MPAGVRFDVDSRDFRRTLARISDAGLKDELRQANKAAAEIVVNAALPNVPVRSGRLRDSVRALAGGLDRMGTESGAKAAAGSSRVPYAAAIHWGRKRGGVIRGRPFLSNAAAKSRRDVVKAYEKSIDHLLRKLRGS